MPLANVALTDTFDTWRVRTNQIITNLEQANTLVYRVINTDIVNVSDNANTTSLLAANVAVSANAYATRVGNSSNSFTTSQLTNYATLSSLNSYLPLSGGTLTGRVGLSSTGFNLTTKDNISTRTDSGFWQTGNAQTGSGWPQSTGSWYHLITSTHANDSNYFSMQFAGDFYDSKALYYRATNGSGSASWSKVWHASNDGAGSGLDADLLDGQQGSYYAPLNNPTFTGTVSVPGSGFYVRRQNDASEGAEFTMQKPVTSSLAGDVIVDINGNNFRIFESGGSFKGVTLDISACGSQSTLLHSSNFSSFSPSLNGTGASGTWNISITGSAASATNASNLGGVAASGYAQLTGASFSGDLTTYRSGSPTTGVIFFGNSGTKYLFYDGTNYIMPGGELYVSGTQVVKNSGTWNISINGSSATFTSTIQNSQFNSLGVGTGASGVSGEIRAKDNITAFYSDKRLKNIINPISLPLEKVKQLSGIVYTNNDVAESFGYHDKSEQVGVIAQDVEKVLPQIVKLAPFDTEYVDGKEVSKSGENYKTVQYEKLIPLLIEAIKELSNEVETLKSKLGE